MSDAHAIPETSNEKALWWALGLTSSFQVAEVAAGIVFKSLALLADVAHMFMQLETVACAHSADGCHFVDLRAVPAPQPTSP